MNISDLKQNAKNSLKGKYGEIIVLFLSFILLVIVLQCIIEAFVVGEGAKTIFNFISLLVIVRLFYFGYCSYFLKISRGEEVTYKELFKKTDLFWTCIILSLLISIFTSFWTLIFIIPGLIASISCSMAYYVVLDNPELDLISCIRQSMKIMKGHKLEYLFLILSFLGWIILGLFTLGILYLWLIPYMQVTIANFYNKIKDK